MAANPTKGYFDPPATIDPGSLGEWKQQWDRTSALALDSPSAAVTTTVVLDANGRLDAQTGAVAVDSFGGSSADDLVKISNDDLPDGRMILLRVADESHAITIKHTAGGAAETIQMLNGVDATMTKFGQSMLLKREGNIWREVGRHVGAGVDDLAPHTGEALVGYDTDGTGQIIGFGAGFTYNSTTKEIEVTGAGSNSSYPQKSVTFTGGQYTLQQADFGQTIVVDEATDVEILIPEGLTVPANRIEPVRILRKGAGAVTVKPESGGATTAPTFGAVNSTISDIAAGAKTQLTGNYDPAGAGGLLIVVSYSAAAAQTRSMSFTFDGNAATELVPPTTNLNQAVPGFVVYSVDNPGTGSKAWTADFGENMNSSSVHIIPITDPGDLSTVDVEVSDGVDNALTTVNFSLTPTDTKRSILFGAAKQNDNQTPASIDAPAGAGTVVIDDTSDGTTGNYNAHTFAIGKIEDAAASQQDMTISWPGAGDGYSYFAVAIKPEITAGGITMLPSASPAGPAQYDDQLIEFLSATEVLIR